MKKNTAPVTLSTSTQTKKLFGVTVDQLKAVHGGGGVIIENPTK